MNSYQASYNLIIDIIIKNVKSFFSKIEQIERKSQKPIKTIQVRINVSDIKQSHMEYVHVFIWSTVFFVTDFWEVLTIRQLLKIYDKMKTSFLCFHVLINANLQ